MARHESATAATQAQTSTYAVEVRDLVKKFGSFTAVDHISFQVRRGEIFGFLGPNGAGKSTTIRMLCGLIRPTSGLGLVDGYDMSTQPHRIRQHIGYMSQKFSLYDDLTVLENITFFAGVYRVDPSLLKERVAYVLELAGLTGHEHDLTASLAGGFKQRLALGCAVLHQPRILFLDEPTSGVDPTSRRNFWDFIYTLAEKGVTVFVTTHYMDEAEYCHRLGLIQAGRLIACGTPAQLKQQHAPGHMVEFSTLNPQATLEALRSHPRVRGTAVFGSKVRAVLTHPRTPREELVKYLEGQGVRVMEAVPHQPTLEDVFVHLVSGGEEGEG